VIRRIFYITTLTRESLKQKSLFKVRVCINSSLSLIVTYNYGIARR